ncbi:MAG: formylmethanofuran dehydrogenase subunit B [Rubripirellula sp.]
MNQVWKHVACPGCGCVCDDITLSFKGETLETFSPACKTGEAWFRNRHETSAVASIEGRDSTVDQALDHAADLLTRADYPLVYGLSRSATPGQRAAVSLADRLGGAVDTTASLCHGPSIMAIQEVGEVTCTLGEVRNRADLVIFWGCNPADSHPRHADRYSVNASGVHVPKGRDDRFVVMVGEAGQIEQWKIDEAGTEPDLRIEIEPGRDFEVLSLLRRMLSEQVGETPSTAARPPAENVSVATTEKLRHLTSKIQTSRYGVVFFGLGLAGESPWAGKQIPQVGHVNVAALLQWVAELNQITRFNARRMRLQGDVSGADNVLCWQTGYPFAVDFSRGYPRYNPGEYSANELLERGDVDLALLVGAETIPYFSDRARQHLDRIPVIILDYPGASSSLQAQVRFTTAVYGLHAEGTAYRMDNVPVPLRALMPTRLPTDEFVLESLQQRYEERCPSADKAATELMLNDRLLG